MKHNEEIIRLQIEKLLGKGYFDICSLDSIARTMNRHIESHPYYTQLRALHCVDYSSMSSQLRADLPGMIVACLRGETEDMASIMTKAVLMEGRSHETFEDIERVAFPASTEKKGILRLLGGKTT